MRYHLIAAVMIAAGCGPRGPSWRDVHVFRQYEQLQDTDCRPLAGRQIRAGSVSKAQNQAIKAGANAIFVQMGDDRGVIADLYRCPDWND